MREHPIKVLPFDADAVHASSTAELEELAVGFALEAFPPEERDAYRAHLGRCELCRQLLGQFRAVADLLPDALEEGSASPGLKRRILTRARGELGTESRPAPAAVREERPSPGGLRWPAWIASRPGWAVAALALLAIGVIAWNISLQLRLDDRGGLAKEQRQFIEAIGAGALVSQLTGTEAAPQASARLVQPTDGGKAFLLVRNLPPLPSGREYQVWRIAGQVPSGAGTFASSGGENQLVVLSVDFFGADAIGVSIEPKGGGLAPSGPIVLLGSLRG